MLPKESLCIRVTSPSTELLPSLSIPTAKVGRYRCTDWFWCSSNGKCYNALAAELEAILFALNWAVEHHWNDFSIISDSKVLVEALHQKKCPDWHLLATFSSVLILLSSFSVCNVFFLKRCFISNVDKLANESQHSHSSVLNCKGEGFPL
ncbi:hypothetical protein G4B88_011785 [Cannabis sativa]|uniref:RNase H type-1 domain-containing protein n=1 Tax=Cannabis sativa TaxID=3483 RepID=A0A7J6DJE6_CANSA|nr:hypothetical protein G4B88_011785 [Cannabis sativa]